MQVGKIYPVSFRSSNLVQQQSSSKPSCENCTELIGVKPVFDIKTPQMYTKIGVDKLENGLEIHSYKLANGHKVTIVPMEGSPSVVKNYVNVGSMNETDDIKGISHFLEHMAFNGTIGDDGYIKLEQGDSFKKIEKMGGWVNASTDYSVTDYINSTPLLENQDLEEQIKVLGSMTYNLALTKEMIEKEKGPVCSEINMILDDPTTVVLDQNVRTLFNVKSSADELVGGSVKHIKNLTREKVKSYYDKYYTPDNMNLVITGDVNPDEVISLVAKNFHSFKKNNAGKHYVEKLHPINKAIRKDFISKKASSTTIVMGFSGFQAKNVKEKVLFDIVSEYINSIEFGLKKDIENYNAFYTLGAQKITNNPNDPYYLSIIASCNDENSENILRSMYSKLLNTQEPSTEYFDSIKENLSKQFDEVLEYSINVNSCIGSSVLTTGNLDYITQYKTILNSLTKEDVLDFIKKYLNPNKAAITVMHPEVEVDKIYENYDKANGISFKAKSRTPLNTDNLEHQVLDNNFKVSILSTQKNEVNLVFDLKCDLRNKGFNPAAIEILNLMLESGTDFKSYEEVNKLQELKNYDINASLNSMGLVLSLNSSKDKFDEAFDLLNELKNSPRLNKEEFDNAVKKMQDYLLRVNKSSNLLYTEYEASQNPYINSLEDMKESLKTVTLEDVKALHNYILNNSKGLATVSVPKNDVEFKNIVLDEINSLPRTKLYNKQTINLYKENRNAVVLTESKEVSQADISQIYHFKYKDEPIDSLKIKIINTLLNTSKNVGLFNTLREKEQLAYSVSADTNIFEDQGSIILNILTTTDNKNIGEFTYDNLQKSINGFNRQVEQLINSEYSDEDLESAKKMLKASMLDNEGTSRKLSLLRHNAINERPLDYLNETFNLIDSITREDIDEYSKIMFKDKPIYSIVASQDTLNYNKDYLNSLK